MTDPMFKLDENLPTEAAEVLRRAEYDASTVLEQNLGGCEDVDRERSIPPHSRIKVPPLFVNARYNASVFHAEAGSTFV